MGEAEDLRGCAAQSLPHRLALLFRGVQPGEAVRVWLPGSDVVGRKTLSDVVHGAGLQLRRRETARPTRLVRFWSLPDTTGPDMRLLVSGLNPSPAAADAGVGFARPGNRFWPAAIAAGMVSTDRDPDHALREHGVGMTDIVKRTTRKADELAAGEYAAGLARLERMVGWLQPRAICFVGLAGWRAARDKRAQPGWQIDRLGEAPVYLMPSTSGLNASSQLPDLTEHLRSALAGPVASPTR